MAGNLNVEVYVWLALNVNDLRPVLRLHPSLGCLIRALIVEVLDVNVGHSWANVGESPGHALVVTYNDVTAFRAASRPPHRTCQQCRCASYHRFGIWWPRCISFDSSGFPVTVCAPETTQSFDPFTGKS